MNFGISSSLPNSKQAGFSRESTSTNLKSSSNNTMSINIDPLPVKCESPIPDLIINSPEAEEVNEQDELRNSSDQITLNSISTSQDNFNFALPKSPFKKLRKKKAGSASNAIRTSGQGILSRKSSGMSILSVDSNSHQIESKKQNKKTSKIGLNLVRNPIKKSLSYVQSPLCSPTECSTITEFVTKTIPQPVISSVVDDNLNAKETLRKKLNAKYNSLTMVKLDTINYFFEEEKKDSPPKIPKLGVNSQPQVRMLSSGPIPLSPNLNIMRNRITNRKMTEVMDTLDDFPIRNHSNPEASKYESHQIIAINARRRMPTIANMILDSEGHNQNNGKKNSIDSVINMHVAMQNGVLINHFGDIYNNNASSDTMKENTVNDDMS